MAFPSRLVVLRNLSHLGVDILVFVATEILVRLMLSDRNAARWRIPLLAMQGVILLAISSLLAFLHHFPYLLAFITLFLFIKLAVFVSGRIEQRNSAVSRPLRYTSDISDVDEFEIDSVNPKRQQTGSVGSATVSSQPGANSLRQRTESSHTDSMQQSIPKDVLTSSFCKPSEVLHEPKAPSNSSITHSQLHRSPLTSSLSQPSPWTMSSHDGQNSDSSLCQHPTLGYFTSFLNFQKPSSTPPGLINVGNTCFLNSILQCLTWTVGFVEVLPLVSPVDDGNSEFIRNLNTVVHQCHVLPDGIRKFEPIDPSGLLISLSKLAPHLVVNPESRRHQSQQDAAECLLWVLDSLHGILSQQSDSRSDQKEPLLSAVEMAALTNKRAACLVELERETSDNSPSFKQCLAALSEVDWELNWQKNSSSIYELFLGQLVEARQCQLCNKMSVNVEYFTVLLLPVPSLAVSDTTHVFKLQDCFEKFSKVEDLVKGNMLHCSCTLPLQDKLTTLTPGRRLALLSRPPKRLVIQLTRFSYDSLRKEALKNTALVTFPLTLDLYPHTMQAKLNPTSQKTSLYHLCAFCVHTGAQSTSFGHYVAYCKAANHQWYYCNDRNVRHIANIVTEMNTTFVLQNAYLLFYALQD